MIVTSVNLGPRTPNPLVSGVNDRVKFDSIHHLESLEPSRRLKRYRRTPSPGLKSKELDSCLPQRPSCLDALPNPSGSFLGKHPQHDFLADAHVQVQLLSRLDFQKLAGLSFPLATRLTAISLPVTPSLGSCFLTLTTLFYTIFLWMLLRRC